MADEKESEANLDQQYTDADERYTDGIIRALQRFNGKPVEGYESPYEDDEGPNRKD